MEGLLMSQGKLQMIVELIEVMQPTVTVVVYRGRIYVDGRRL